MIIYSITTDPFEHFENQSDAFKAARAAADSMGYEIEVYRHSTVDLTKANLCDILNTQGGSWSRDSDLVGTFSPRRGRKKP